MGTATELDEGGAAANPPVDSEGSDTKINNSEDNNSEGNKNDNVENKVEPPVDPRPTASVDPPAARETPVRSRNASTQPLNENRVSTPAEDSPAVPSANIETAAIEQQPGEYNETTAISTSLAFCRSTPCWAKFFLPIFCLATHALFYYGQTAPMWKLRAYADINAWANATDFAARRTFDVVGLKYELPFVYEQEEDVQTFTYYFAIHHLWEAKGLPGKALPRLAAVLLIIFSGIWPHLKLLWLNLTWFFGKPPRRTTTLHWLSTLGKWSLADVLVVCVMVGVLHLDWIVEPADIKAGIITDMPALLQIVQSMYTSESLCDKLLKMTCAKQKRVDNIAKCKACRNLVEEAFYRPEWAQSTGKAILDGVDTSGGGLATLRVVGMRGIYAFSGAVIISILLSLVVDIFDHRAKQQVRKDAMRELGRQRLERVMRRRQQNETGEGTDTLEEPLLSDDNGPSPLEVESGEDEVILPPARATHFSIFFIIIGLITTAFVFMAVDLDTMERQVSGAGPMLLHDILGVNWQKDYSLRTLMWTTGAAGSWDYLLMGTFALFIVLGPVIRAVLVNVVTLLDRCHVPVSSLAVLVNFVGAFCSWEVFAIAIVMVQMLMPSITNTIINTPVCGKISEDGSCLQVEFNILPNSFSTIVIGGILLVVMSWQVVNRATDRGNDLTPVQASTSPRRRTRVMHANHNYQRLQLVGQQTSEDEGDLGLEEVVFETNQRNEDPQLFNIQRSQYIQQGTQTKSPLDQHGQNIAVFNPAFMQGVVDHGMFQNIFG